MEDWLERSKIKLLPVEKKILEILQIGMGCLFSIEVLEVDRACEGGWSSLRPLVGDSQVFEETNGVVKDRMRIIALDCDVRSLSNRVFQQTVDFYQSTLISKSIALGRSF